jgi:hypothetical protein
VLKEVLLVPLPPSTGYALRNGLLFDDHTPMMQCTPCPRTWCGAIQNARVQIDMISSQPTMTRRGEGRRARSLALCAPLLLNSLSLGFMLPGLRCTLAKAPLLGAHSRSTLQKTKWTTVPRRMAQGACMVAGQVRRGSVLQEHCSTQELFHPRACFCVCMILSLVYAACT